MKKKLHCWYFIATGMLFAVGLLGQLLCDGLGYSIMTGKYLLYILCFVVVCAVCYGVLRLLHGKGRLRRGIAWVLGTIVVAWTGFASWLLALRWEGTFAHMEMAGFWPAAPTAKNIEPCLS